MVAAKDRVRALVPLPVRMRLATWLTRGRRWLPLGDHVAMGLVRDLATSDPKTFHKFLWANHFAGYAHWYDSEDELFRLDRVQSSRIELFRDLLSVLDKLGLKPRDVRSVLEVGCSQGHLLRYLETEVLPPGAEFVGIDIDRPGIEKGAKYLKKAGSNVVLIPGDMEDLAALVGGRSFDFIFAAGVLSYLNEPDAQRMVALMLRRTGRVLALAGLACADRNNNELPASVLSPSHAGQWIHNFDALVRNAGGRVVRSRWEGARLYNQQTVAFAFAVPEPK